MLEQALGFHQAGRLQEAEQLYRQVLEVEPRHPEALHLLGVLAHHTGHLQVAVDLIRAALKEKPGAGHFQNNLGNVLRDLGRPADAEMAYREALRLDPRSLDAQSNLGVVLRELGRREEALEAFRQAVAAAPGDPDLHSNLAGTLIELGQFTEALASAGEAIRLAPAHPDAHCNLGEGQRALGQFEDAIRTLKRANDLRPDHVPTLVSLGNALSQGGRHAEATFFFRRALEINPQTAPAQNGLSRSLGELGRFEEAVEAARQALLLDPQLAEACLNLSVALSELGKDAEALEVVRQGCELAPGSNALRLASAYLSLLHGDYAEGFRLYEARSEAPGFPAIPRFTQPRWQGEPLAGRTLLLHAEQGFGDTIQFIRFVPELAARGDRVIVDCQPALADLLGSLPGIAAVVPRGRPWPAFDTYLPLLSLPFVLGATRETIPQNFPYLAAESGRVTAWKARLGNDRSRLRVGLAWTGSPGNPGNPFRSLPLEELAPLFAITGVDFFSLQKGAGTEQLESFSQREKLIDHPGELADFSHTAALLSQLDLVISIDTAVLHLAGALGRPVWALLRFAADWRYGLRMASTPWYPEMRLFRQARSGEWAAVVAEVGAELARHAAADRAGRG